MSCRTRRSRRGGGATHAGGASHGALLAGYSLGPLVLCGLEPGVEEVRQQWALRDVARLVLDHFGVSGEASIPPFGAGGATGAEVEVTR